MPKGRDTRYDPARKPNIIGRPEPIFRVPSIRANRRLEHPVAEMYGKRARSERLDYALFKNFQTNSTSG